MYLLFSMKQNHVLAKKTSCAPILEKKIIVYSYGIFHKIKLYELCVSSIKEKKLCTHMIISKFKI